MKSYKILWNILWNIISFCDIFAYSKVQMNAGCGRTDDSWEYVELATLVIIIGLSNISYWNYKKL